MRYDDDERVASCQREIQRLRRVVRDYEAAINEVIGEVTEKYEKSREKNHGSEGATDTFGYSKQLEVLNELRNKMME